MKKLKIEHKYSQQDPRWRDKKLGLSGTIGKYGCLLTSLAMLSSYYGFPETPDTLNTTLKKIGGYANGNLYVWGSLGRIHQKIKFKKKVSTPTLLTKAQMNEIRESIDKGFPVIIQIDRVPATSALDEHWVLVYGYDGDDLFLVDSWDGKEKRITDWGISPQKMIWAYTLIEGPVVASPPSGEYKTITDFLVSVGYTYPEAHLEVIQEMHKSDLKIKSGKYILREDCSKEKENLKTEHEKECNKKVTSLKLNFKTEKKKGINDALKKAKKEWKVTELENKVTEYEKIANSAVYKMAKAISEIFKELNIINKLGDK